MAGKGQQFIIELPTQPGMPQRWVKRVCREQGSYYIAYERTSARRMSGGIVSGAFAWIGVPDAKVVPA
ncbi:hypothetical protein [Methylibium petroleiphilum]|uniref:hypothetical protein n=1 Tax=Methylibium petroleiphilum TaxID=105560 RepID=UPI00003CC91F|nr:hypothetical protein [Methylibium petroleiphilum]